MRTSPPRGTRQGGFTLIELMIVVVVVGILAAIAIPRFGQVSNRVKEGETQAILKQIYTLQLRFKQKNDSFAEHFDQLEGAADPVGSARYYDFRIAGDVTTFTACAQPKAGYEQLGSFQIDQLRQITRLAAAGDCVGNTL